MNETKPPLSGRMMYTPQCHIPIGEVVNQNGEVALRIKKPNTKSYETITLGALVSQATSIAAESK